MTWRLPSWTVLCACVFMLPQAHAQEDSTKVYKDIEQFSARHGFTRWVYQNIFVAPVRNEEPPAPAIPQRRTNPMEPFAGRTVRSVEVVVLDPFGYGLVDSSAIPTSWVQRAANSLHRTTRQYLVREFVLVKAGEAFDPLEASESERLLRSSPMVNDARVRVMPVDGSADTVDVQVIVLDTWNLEAWVDLSSSAGRVTVQDRNLLGLGQQLQFGPTFTTERLLQRFDALHSVYNIKGTYISSLIDYGRDDIRESIGLRLIRPFYSPLTRWAGAFGVNRSMIKLIRTDAQGAILGTDRVDQLDISTWLGRSFPLENTRSTPARSSSIVTGVLHSTTRFLQRPASDGSGPIAYPNTELYLLSAGLSVRQYYRERYLYRFGMVEDVPEGLLLKLTGGFRRREGEDTLLGYTGVEFSRGRHFHRFGYAAFQLAYGTFWQQGKPVDATLRMDLRYFTDLFRMQRWYVRQFITLAATQLDRREPTARLDLNGDQLFGFQSALVSGTHRELLKLETVVYAPYRLLGFRFAPVLLAGFGTIGDTEDPLFSGRIHTALGLGILIRNENLLIKTFELSFSLYPYIPEENGAVFDADRFTNFTARLNDFAFTSPGLVGY